MRYVTNVVISIQLTSSYSDGFRFDSDVSELLTKPPSDEKSAQIRGYLYPSAYLSYGWSGLNYSDAVASLSQAVRRCKTSKATSNNNNVER